MKHEADTYFYVHPDDVHREYFILKDDEYHHAVHVLRLNVGAVITAVDGEGNEILGEINAITPGKEVRCAIIKKRRKPNEPLLDITLMQSLLKGDRFDYIVEKAVELGVNTIIPVHAERCIADASPQKIRRWQRIAKEAMKQSCRSVMPVVTEVMECRNAFEFAARASSKFVLHKDGRMTIAHLFDELKSSQFRRSIAVAVGPEGDFTPDELNTALECSFKQISLGPRRLRSDTAGLAAVAILLARDM